jgi:ATP-binding cassette subfamily B protein
MPEREFQKPKDFKGSLRRLIKEFAGPRKSVLAVLFLLLVGGSVLSIVTPIVLRDTLNNFSDYISLTPIDSDHMEVSVMWGRLFASFGVMLAFYVGASLLSWAAEWIGVKVAQDYGYRLRRDFKDKLDTLPLRFFDAEPYGVTLNKGTNDIDNISGNVYTVFSQSVSAITMFIGVSVAMFVTSWQLSLVVYAIMPIMAVTVAIIGVRSQKEFRAYRHQYGILEGKAEEAYSGFKIIKLFGEEGESSKIFAETNDPMTVSDRRSQWISGFIFPFMRFIYNAGFVAIAVASGLMNDKIGDLVAFVLFLNLFQQPFMIIGQISSQVQSLVSSSERVYAVLDEKSEEPDPEDAISDVSHVEGGFSFEGVNFSYTKERELIKDLNLKVAPGETVAIVGPTGAGKTTIVNLIMRFYEIDSGSIKLDGVSTKQYKRSSLRGLIGMVLQDTWLFNGTVKENIRYGNEKATDEEVVAAAKAARADEFITSLPGGYDFVLSEDGTNVSQGQRQLITIARAIVSNPRILILDEATSSVDTRTEMAIQEALDRLMEGKTAFVIAHRLSTIKKAKLILVMDKGRIVEMGNHEELLAKKGFYADLYNSQFLGRNPLAPKEEPD